MVSRKIKILAVDDNLDNLISIKALINDAFPEIDVFTAPSGRQGFDLAVAEDPDVILLDVIMPGMDGFEVCRKLKTDPVLRDIPIIFVTAMKGDKEGRILALECGAEAFLAKPIDKSELIAQIRAMLKIRAANIQKRENNEWLTALVEEKTSDLKKENESRKLAQKESQETALRFYSLFDHLSSGVAIYKVQNDGSSGKDYIIVDFNRAALEMERKEKEEVIGKSLFDLRPNIDQFGLIPIFQKVWKTGESAYFPSKVYVDENFDNWYENRVYKLPSGEIVAIYNDITEKTNIENELTENRILMASIINNTTDAIYVKNIAGQYLLFNHGAEIITGKSAAEALGKDDLFLFPEKEARVIMDGDRKAIENKRVVTYEEAATDSLGRLSSYLSTKGPIYDKDQKIIGLFGIAHDITGRKRAESEIRHERDIAKMYLDIAAVILIAIGKDEKVLLINRKGCEILKLSQEEIVGKNWFDNFLPPSIVKDVRQAFRRMMTGDLENFEHFENPVTASNGQERLIDWQNTFIYDNAGNITGMFSSGTDVTEQKTMEHELWQSEKKYSSYIENAPDGIFVTDQTGKYIEVNKAAAEITGYSKEQLLQMNIRDITTDEFLEVAESFFEKLYIEGSMRRTLQYKHKDGSHRWWTIDAVKISDEYYLGFFKDVTENKRAEAELIFMSYHDQLTGVYNRRFFEEEIKRLDTKRNFPLTIVMSDINGLKLINDSFGHAVGDELLKKAAETISKGSRAGDIIARLGGDEFGIILPNTDEVEAAQIIIRIKDLASNVKIANVSLSISLGYETKAAETQDIRDITASAENHMYRHKLYERTSMRSRTIDIIMNTLYEKSSRELQHSKRVSEICRVIASRMNFDKDDIGQIKTAGLVHDIGKIGIDEKILNEAGTLSSNEWKEIRKHPEAGSRILSSTKEFSELSSFILAHHERWDGSGYPNGLRGEEIPIEARIITIADAYDAMTSQRSYKKGIDKAQAAEELKRCSGTQFDPSVVDIFVNQVLPTLAF